MLETADRFEVIVDGKGHLFRFERSPGGIFVGVSDELRLTVEGDSLGECREAAAEAVQLLLDDEREDVT